MDSEVKQVLKDCEVKSLMVYLPERQLDRKLYLQVSKALESIGGKWNRKYKGFIFITDPQVLMDKLIEGESVNLKKEYQFFETPPDLADYLVSLADLSSFDTILEPSAGQGAIIQAINKVAPNICVSYCELMETNRIILTRKNLNCRPVGVNGDFLTSHINKHNKIIANPPFHGNQDIDHIYKMWECLAEGGRIVTIASLHWRENHHKKESDFQRWVLEHNVDLDYIRRGEFKESGTLVGGCVMTIDKDSKAPKKYYEFTQYSNQIKAESKPLQLSLGLEI
jgi:hypothetical protein